MTSDIYELAVSLRHELHAHPELSHHETWTKRRLMDFLARRTRLELTDQGPWFYARFRSGTDRGPIAFRADFDALPMQENTPLPYRSQCPGVAHKCGHDGHSAALAALALELDRGGADRDVYLIFQHAEEVGGGGQACARLLRQARVQEVYAFHTWSGYPQGAVCVRDGVMNCASKGMTITFTGVPAHASMPELGKNPAFSIAHLVDAIPALLHPEDHRGLVQCTVVQMTAGRPAFGLAAHEGRLLLTLRAQYQEELDLLQAVLETLAAREAEAAGLEWAAEYCDEFPETANDPACAEKVRRAARQLGLPLADMPEPARASEDFGWYLREVPGALFFLGNGPEYPPLHSEAFDFPDQAIPLACSLFRTLIGL